MKKFLALVNREAEGKILQEYAEQQCKEQCEVCECKGNEAYKE
jgi:hypothetical protein